MIKVVLIFSLIVVAIGLYNHNNNPLPQFSDSQSQFICIEEGLECQNTF